ncbi:SRPBCC family protein [Streptosporangium sp. NPDC000396]|uniref:SRPBCC family protein n=1 Tax=Streptosporangium sp. NPDC000396 TaxID=3366185 RepID=UPI0036D19031
MVYNMHERVIPASPERVWDLLVTIGSDQDRLWPKDLSSFRTPEGVAPGAPVVHSSARYRVSIVEPGRRLWFDLGKSLSGGHGFTLHPVEGGTLVRHELKGRTGGMFRLLWPLVIRRKHDVVVEKILDNLAREISRAHAD